MGSMKQVKERRRRPKNGLRRHKRSVVIIIGILCLMGIVALVGGVKVQQTNREYKEQERELQAQIDEEKDRSEEIDELEKYIGTDQYIEEVAKEKLGLVHENEILFRPE